MLEFALSTLVALGISYYFYKRSTKDLDKGLSDLAYDVIKRDSFEQLEYMLVKSKWTSVVVEGKVAWICDQNSAFKIVENDEFEDFDEDWATKHVPDSHAKRSTVDLLVHGDIVRSLTFISIDGGRYFVPITAKSARNGSEVYSWERNSLQFKVCNVVGKYYRYDSIEKVAKRFGVEIVQRIA